jgi:hypothetical protein
MLCATPVILLLLLPQHDVRLALLADELPIGERHPASISAEALIE